MIKGTVYKLFSKNAEDFYVGSSMRFHCRKLDHKNNCKNSNKKEHTYPVYKYIREHGDYSEWEYEILEENEYEDKHSMKVREHHFIKTLNSKLNSQMPNIYGENWRKMYYEKNKPEISKKKAVKVHCELCDCKFSKSGFARHNKTNKHIKNLGDDADVS